MHSIFNCFNCYLLGRNLIRILHLLLPFHTSCNQVKNIILEIARKTLLYCTVCVLHLHGQDTVLACLPYCLHPAWTWPPSPQVEDSWISKTSLPFLVGLVGRGWTAPQVLVEAPLGTPGYGSHLPGWTYWLGLEGGRVNGGGGRLILFVWFLISYWLYCGSGDNRIQNSRATNNMPCHLSLAHSLRLGTESSSRITGITSMLASITRAYHCLPYRRIPTSEIIHAMFRWL